ncbi:MAG: helix-turn-helix transcriptional regulator [Xanthomonadaceae bacterium]|nr:helix-turn-helix transcriptional regulator [Xanthomonadaceae bacterium]
MTHLHSITPATVAITDDERIFFIELGTRITALRKTQRITQVQLAEQLGVSQQTVTAYESGKRRVPISHLPRLAGLLGVTVEELLGTQAKRSAGKRGPAPKLQQQLEQIQALPKAKQRAITQVLDSVIAAHQ